jgi:hypothetical protein
MLTPLDRGTRKALGNDLHLGLDLNRHIEMDRAAGCPHTATQRETIRAVRHAPGKTAAYSTLRATTALQCLRDVLAAGKPGEDLQSVKSVRFPAAVAADEGSQRGEREDLVSEALERGQANL